MTTISDNAADIRQQLGLDVANTPTFAGVNADTISEKNTNNGVNIEDVLCKDGNIITSVNAADLSSNILAPENMTGIMISRSNNYGINTGSGLWFGSPDTFFSGIACNYPSDTQWGTTLDFYTHQYSTTELTTTTKRMSLRPDGELVIGTDPTGGSELLRVGGSIACPNSGAGIRLPSSPGNSGVNVLDCYEEGTWEPIFSFTNPGNYTAQYNFRWGRYTRIGNKVDFMLSLMLIIPGNDIGTASGDLTISLPFTTISEHICLLTTRFYPIQSTPIHGNIPVNANRVFLMKSVNSMESIGIERPYNYTIFSVSGFCFVKNIKELQMKVIIKSIENQQGHLDECHVAEWGELNLKGGTGRLRLYSYASKAAYEAGKPATTNRDVNLSFADIVNFEPLWTELATKLLSDPASKFVGGTLEDTTEIISDPIIYEN